MYFPPFWHRYPDDPYGPIYYRLLLRTAPVTPEAVPAMIDRAFAGVAATAT